MITFDLNTFDPFKDNKLYLDNYSKWLTAFPLLDMINYVNALNQVHMGVFYRHINGEIAKFFGFPEPKRPNNCFFTDLYLDLIVNYQQQNIKIFFNKMLSDYS